MKIHLFVLSISILVFGGFAFSCGKSNYQEAPTIINSKKLNIQFEYYELGGSEIDTIGYTIFDTYAFADQDYLLVFNTRNRQIEIYDLSGRKRLFAKPLRNFFNTTDYGEILGVHFYSFDSIFVSQERMVTILDTNTVLRQIPLNVPEKRKWSSGGTAADLMYLYDPGTLFPIRYDPKANGVLLHSFCIGCGGENKKYFHSPIEALVPLEGGAIEYYPISYSKLYLDDYYGFAKHIYRITVGDTSFISFITDPNIYGIDRREKEKFVIGGRSPSQTKDLFPLAKKHKRDTEEKMNHLSSIPLYRDIRYDPHRKLFYRFFSDYQPIKNADGTYNSFGDKALSLLVFNESFELISEIDLGKYKYISNKSFVTKDGLYLSASHYKYPERSNKKLQFDVLKISVP